MKQYPYLTQYFETEFEHILDTHVLLQVDVPLLVTFKSDTLYMAYLSSLDDDLNAIWFISETTPQDIYNLLCSELSVLDLMSKQEHLFIFSVMDGETHLQSVSNTNLNINSKFYLTPATPNEISKKELHELKNLFK